MNKEERAENRKRIWKHARPFAAVLLSLLLVTAGVFLSVRYILSHFIYPVDEEDSTPIEVVIPSGVSASRIASLLYNARGENEKGLIVNTASFKIYVDFVGKANSLQAGTYLLSRNMSIPEIVDILAEGSRLSETVRVTVPEGYTVESIAQLLKEQGVLSDTADFLTLCAASDRYDEYTFLPSSEETASARYYLEGYLFPDTYDLKANSPADEVIRKFLSRFGEVFGTLSEQTRSTPLSAYETVILASMIEREAALEDDFYRVSAVFRNRIEADMPFESCATLSYALGVNKLTFSGEELATESAYNTYRSKGFPAGPICSPGRTAVRAALQPNSTYVNEGYLYFCNGNPAASRALLFSRTYEEHAEKVEQNRQYWQ